VKFVAEDFNCPKFVAAFKMVVAPVDHWLSPDQAVGRQYGQVIPLRPKLQKDLDLDSSFLARRLPGTFLEFS